MAQRTLQGITPLLGGWPLKLCIDLCRAQSGLSRRVPGLKYCHIVRDSWTRLNVLPAKIMQVQAFINHDYYHYYYYY